MSLAKRAMQAAGAPTGVVVAARAGEAMYATREVCLDGRAGGTASPTAVPRGQGSVQADGGWARSTDEDR
jgi:hypothetical protein